MSNDAARYLGSAGHFKVHKLLHELFPSLRTMQSSGICNVAQEGISWGKLGGKGMAVGGNGIKSTNTAGGP